MKTNLISAIALTSLAFALSAGCATAAPLKEGSPSPAANASPFAATPADSSCRSGPSDREVSEAAARASIPEQLRAAGFKWTPDARGNSQNCELYWVHVGVRGAAGSIENILFFDHNRWLGTATQDPRPDTAVIAAGGDTVTVRYRWANPGEPVAAKTGAADVRYQLVNGTIRPLDPIPAVQHP